MGRVSLSHTFRHSISTHMMNNQICTPTKYEHRNECPNIIKNSHLTCTALPDHATTKRIW